VSTGPTAERGLSPGRVQHLGPRSTPPPPTVAYSDGSCLGNPGPGGWGVHAELPDGSVLELGGGELDTTNNRMELRAAIEAARLTARCPAVVIVTDSSYVRGGITSWLLGWQRNGWKTATGKPVENQALWRELAALADDRITWQWTRGHAGTPGNERCDQIARWFARGIAPLGRARRTRTAQASGRSVNSPAPGTHYLSLVDGIVARHATWADCAHRVHGARGARFKKVRSPEEELATIAAWGLPADALEYL
jgi:ribonuclease HI